MSAPTVIIGGGHNGLVAAITLARAGRRVVVLEARDAIGGLARGEVFGDGFRTTGLLHDASSLRPVVVKALDLAAHGLKLRSQPYEVTLPAADGPSIRFRGDHVEGVSADEQARYGEFRALVDRFRKPIGKILSEPALDPLGSYLPLLGPLMGIRALGARDMTTLMRIPPMAVADWMRDALGNEHLRAGIAHRALIGEWLGPWSPWSAANLLLATCTEGPGVVGGPAAVAAALESAAIKAGVEIRTGARVARICFEGERASGVELEGGEVISAATIASSCDPHHTFLELVGPSRLSDRLGQNMRNVRVRGVTAKFHIGIKGVLADRDGHPVEAMRTGETLDDLERAFDALKYGEISERPILDIRVPSIESPDLAPEGHQMVSIMVHFAPYALRAGWDDGQRQRLSDRALGVLEGVCPGVRQQIVATETLTPVDIEARYGATHGHIFHGEHAPDQLMFMRPTIQCARHRTPVEGLYLCGSGAHPGGGITGMPGMLGARAVLAGN
jgi:phytoene dehydrogenase-like protein